MQVEPRLPAANQVATSAAFPVADTVPVKRPPDTTDAGMPPASPASLLQDFSDGATASAMLLWAEDNELPLDTARQVVQAQPASQSACFSISCVFAGAAPTSHGGSSQKTDRQCLLSALQQRLSSQ